MNDFGTKWMLSKMDERQRRNSGMSDNRPMDERDMNDMGDYYDSLDSRRGVRGSGRRDMRDFAEDLHRAMKLTKTEGNKWLHEMQNTYGTTGPHYSMQEVMQAAEKLGIKFNEFSEREFYIATNMWYSDFGHVTKRVVGDNPEKESLVNADYTRAFFDDPDGADAGEKLAVVYHCMRG
jgi:hypothetical protein